MTTEENTLAQVIENAGVLVNNNRLVEMFRSALSAAKHAYEMVPDLVEEMIEDDAWRDFMDRNRGRQSYQADEFRRFIEEQPPRGLGSTVDDVRKLLGGPEDPIRLKFEALVANAV